MNLKQFGINWNEVEESSFKPLPPGTYAAKVTESSVKDSKTGGKYLAIEFTILSNTKGVKGRKVFENFTLAHPNEKAVSVGRGRIKSLGKKIEVDFDSMEDSSELHDKPVGLVLTIESDEKYGEKNRIKSFEEYEEEMLESGEVPF